MKLWIGTLLIVSLMINVYQSVKLAQFDNQSKMLEVRLGIKQQWIDMEEVAMTQAQIDLMNCKNSLVGKRYVPLKRVTH